VARACAVQIQRDKASIIHMLALIPTPMLRQIAATAQRMYESKLAEASRDSEDEGSDDDDLHDDADGFKFNADGDEVGTCCERTQFRLLKRWSAVGVWRVQEKWKPGEFSSDTPAGPKARKRTSRRSGIKPSWIEMTSLCVRFSIPIAVLVVRAWLLCSVCCR
jgi:hypothetical protein